MRLNIIFFVIIITIFISNNLISQVSISTDGSAPNQSAMLDVKSTNKGLLVPRVALTGTGDITTVPNRVESLLIYNTATAGTSPNNVTPGYYYWSGTKWVLLQTNLSVPNEGVVKINSGSGGVKPYFNITTANDNTYLRVNYNTPLIYASSPTTSWPETVNIGSTPDLYIIGNTAGVSNFMENPVLGQVHLWRIIVTYTGKNTSSTVNVSLRLRNPSSGFAVDQTIGIRTSSTTGSILFNLMTIADNASLPSYLIGSGTGSGYVMEIASDDVIKLTIDSVTRVSQYKD